MAKKASYAVNNFMVDFVSGSRNTLYASWAFSHKNLENFTVIWQYRTGNVTAKNADVWFEGSNSTTEARNAQYTIPDNAIQVRVAVKPNSKKHSVKVNGKQVQTTYWNGIFTKPQWLPVDAPGYQRITKPDKPEIEPDIPNKKVRVWVTTYDNVDRNSTATYMEYELIEDDKVIFGQSIQTPINPVTGYTSVSFSINKGHEYKARCRARSASTGGIYSEWSDYSDSKMLGPAAIRQTSCICTSDTSVRLEWEPVSGVYNYEVQYVKDHEEYFDTNPSAITSDRPNEENTTCIRDITGLDNTEGGHTYYFRIRGHGNSSNDLAGPWPALNAYAVMATDPNPPTTWSYKSTGKIGDTFIINWIHNSEDNSVQKEAMVTFTWDTGAFDDHIIGDANTYAFDTRKFPSIHDNTEIEWYVKTKGVAVNWSDPSTTRKFTVYEEPKISYGLYDNVNWYWDNLDFDNGDIFSTDGSGENPIQDVTRFPFVLNAVASPDTQTVISFAVTITSNNSYDTFDETGSGKHVFVGDEVFSGYFIPVNNEMTKVFKPYDVDLEDGMSYTCTIIAAMDSGLSAEVSFTFSVEWQETFYNPNAEITTNDDTYAVYIRPFCEDENENEVKNVYMSVYRREYDGRFTEIVSNLDGELATTVIDPHPSLDYARYRVIASSKDTGAISYIDIPAVEIGCDSIIIQWNETQIPFDDSLGESIYLVDQPEQGSMLKLPYNIDVSVDNKPDVELVEYIGRESPVSYYGTQRGETTKWDCEIPKSDKETLYQIRRLAAYMGDVYVREPSGIGYWANITVSYNIQHLKSTIPVSFNITRVEGGM